MSADEPLSGEAAGGGDQLLSRHAEELKDFGDPPPFDIRMFPLLGMDNDRSIVTIHASTEALRDIVEQIGRQFKRELGYDFPPFDPDDPDRDAVLINSWKFHATFLIAAGAAEFMRDDAGWIMTWIWLHPYERGGRLIEKAWPELEARYGEFRIEAPYSPAMEAFMRRHAITDERRFG
jgi:hypothetical protein